MDSGDFKTYKSSQNYIRNFEGKQCFAFKGSQVMQVKMELNSY